MNLWTKAVSLFRRVLSLTDPAGWSREGQSHAGEPVNAGSALALSSVWACVNLLAGTIASLPIVVYRSDGKGGRVVAKDHWAYRLLHDSPNADQTAVDFWEGAYASLELKGNAVADIERSADGKRVIALTPIAWDALTVTRDRDGTLVYRWADQTRRQDDVLHIRGFGGAPEGGLSTLAFARHAFGLATAIDRAAGQMFANGVRPSGLLKFDKWLTDDQARTAETRMQEKFVGTMNAGKPMVLEGGVTWQQLTINPEDAQMLQSRGFSVEECCRFFGVPPFMIGHNEKSSGYPTSLEQQVLTFQKFALRRRLKRAEQAMEKQLLTPADRAAGITIEYNLEGLLRGDSAARSAFYQSALNNGWMTINEVRALENMLPVPGGDVPRMQMQNVPITQANGQQVVS
ncbi:phage portal protein [Sphingomonas corticis]|uniref:Phage portal protein n=1 Tax=Sphingomonas corticis TaxID=2722791 RepID=A0ABX1CR77_9SPHN|nr:phage portal protein [Sphingomonas corticis]NJR80444.1 phage portal protein [Sphingomonas corticis]